MKPSTPQIPETMRALEQTSGEGPRDMRLVPDAPVPTGMGREDVLIRVAAAGINFADVSRAHGTFFNGPMPPFVAGFEAAGEIVAVGDGVTRFQTGARIVGVGRGAFAEYMVLSAAGAMPVPAGWTAEQSLGLVVNWPTAIAALRPLGRLARGEVVLIHAAAGATGQAAVKLAKYYGATVIATASVQKHDLVRSLGADHVLDARRDDLAAAILERTEGAGVDLVLESIGGVVFHASLAATKRVTGRVVVFGVAGGDATITSWELVYKHQVHLIGLNLGVLIQSTPHLFGEVVGELSTLLANGVITPTQPTTYPLAHGQRALSELQARATVGKLALLP